MKATYKGRELHAWIDDGGVLNYELRGTKGNVLAAGFDITGTMARDDAMKKMREWVDSGWRKKERDGISK